jgi:hypothetical protein
VQGKVEDAKLWLHRSLQLLELSSEVGHAWLIFGYVGHLHLLTLSIKLYLKVFSEVFESFIQV